ncbi:MAG: YfdX family protein [Thiothrix sp.]
MNVNQHKPLTVAVLAAMILASSGNVLAETAKAATATATAVSAPAKDTATPADAGKADNMAAQPPVVVDEGTAVTNQPAIDALQQITDAEKALGSKDIKTAQSALDEADKLLKSFKDELPTAKVKQKLEAAKDKPEDADWASIYQQLDQVMLFLPQAETKQANAQPAATDSSKPPANAEPAKADSDKAADASKTTQAAPSAESLNTMLLALQYTEIDLPVKTAINSVEKAQQALKKENIKAATEALTAAENNVVVLQGFAEEPLTQAHLSLWQALANMKKGSTDEAKRYLNDAIGFLDQAKQSGDKATKEAADKLLAEGKELQTELNKEGSDATSVTGKLERFGLHTEAWAERAINHAYAKAEEVTGNALKDALIEARFHISNASIELYTAQDPVAAQQELTQAQSFLKQALQKTDDLWADVSHKKQVTDMQTQLDKLAQEPPQQLAGGKQLPQLRQELQTVIQAL